MVLASTSARPSDGVMPAACMATSKCSDGVASLPCGRLQIVWWGIQAYSQALRHGDLQLFVHFYGRQKQHDAGDHKTLTGT